jgi:hypothetical protein
MISKEGMSSSLESKGDFMLGQDQSNGSNFKEIKRQELKEILKRREELGLSYAGAKEPDGIEDQLVGLAFSGGGIRSATFNLGVLQGLAKLGLLPWFDYLSTVSGGGYIGSWLAAWIKREGLNNVIGGLSSTDSTGQWAEAPPIHWLRRYSNYLTPRLGFFSADTWAMVATYLRNLLLNLVILVASLAALLLLPRIVVLIAKSLGPCILHHPFPYLVGIFVFLGIAAVLIALNMEAIASPPQNGSPRWTRQTGVLVLIVVPLVIAAWLSTCWIWSMAEAKCRPDWASDLFNSEHPPWLWWIVGLAAGYTAPWLVGCVIVRWKGVRDNWWVLPLTAFPAGLFGGILFWLAARLFKWWSNASGGLEHAMSSGTPLMLLLFTLVAVLHIGLMGTEFEDPKREWWARLGGHLLVLSLLWAVIFGVALYSPLVLMALGVWAGGKTAGGILGGGWILSTLGGVLGGSSAKSGTKESKRYFEIAIQIAPYIFVLGLLVLITVGSHFALTAFTDSANLPKHAWELIAHGKTEWSEIGSRADLLLGYSKSASVTPTLPELHWAIIKSTQCITLLGLSAVILLALALVLAWRVDINQFSMHLFYRNRLVRCYMGASNKQRKQQPFTGFSAQDDELLCNFSADPNNHYAGPYLLINAALNLVKTKDLAWQRRKAASFIFSPRFCGFHYTTDSPEEPAPSWLSPNAYRATREYAHGKPGGMHLGTALAISGAAASPNMGYHSSPALAFLMTVFNVRLGWWSGNPRHKKCWDKASPQLGPYYLLCELTGNTNDERGYVYLSDGGHFENLGIYELVRRRCRYIVVCDGSADDGVRFEDLGNAIEKCRTDFGTDIEIDTTQLQPKTGSRESKWHCALGRIRYDLTAPGGSEGILVYLKTSLTGDEPADVRHYATANAMFPHESTADQFFDEMQFESYRALGYHVVQSAFGVLEAPEVLKTWSPEKVFVAMRQRWFPPSIPTENAFTKHSATLQHIFETIRCTPDLTFLDEQIYPEWNTGIRGTGEMCNVWLPLDPRTQKTDDVKVRAGFYLCNQVIQLMEDVYTDLKLESEFEHPDNRGWMNLFKHWSWSGMFRLTYAISACTYGIRFQAFCKRHLDLNLGQVVVGNPMKLPYNADLSDPAWDNPPSIRAKFNFVELNVLSWFVKTHLSRRSQIYPLEIHVYDPVEGCLIPQPGNRRHTRSFVFGLCVTRRTVKTEIRFLRVQDHLQEMDLERSALKAILKTLVPGGASLRDKVEVDLIVPNEPAARGISQEHLASLFNSVLRDLERERAIA